MRQLANFKRFQMKIFMKMLGNFQENVFMKTFVKIKRNFYENVFMKIF